MLRFFGDLREREEKREETELGIEKGAVRGERGK